MTRFRKLYRTQDNFYPEAPKMRGYYDSLVQDPQSLDSKRFAWDFWHVPDQYRLLRTPAYHYFPEKMYQAFHHHLVNWGRRNLGCWDISPPWLSCYIDGCFQDFHRDVPHGPWAFVYSLSPKDLPFLGGETELLKSEILSLWSQKPGSATSYERSGILETIKPSFNRLTVFDGRVPHRVRQVKGPLGPETGRLVIHGWFTAPKTFIDGYHPEDRCQAELEAAFDQVLKAVSTEEFQSCRGTMGVGLKVLASGKVEAVKILSNSVVDFEGLSTPRLDRGIQKIYQGLDFGRARGSTEIVVPLILD